MKKLMTFLAVFLVAAAGGGWGYLHFRQPARHPPRDIKVPMTPERIARGQYLFEVVADCAGCHSERDVTKFSMPVLPGRLAVGFVFPAELGLPGKVVSPNLTPDPETGLGAWTDGEKIRAIREGISRDGRALFPFMPYQSYARMSDEDVESIVAFLNSLPPVRQVRPRTELDFPLPLLIKSEPRPLAGPVAAPNPADPLKYGEYLTGIGGCMICHTPMEKGKPRLELAYAGGEEFRIAGFLVRSANITPDPETGLGSWTEERFVKQFHNYRSFAEGTPPKTTQANFTLMPWVAMSRFTESDLKAIYAFLRTVKPIRHPVDKHPEQPAS